MPSASATAAMSQSQPPQYRAVGVVLAIGSGVLIGSSFVFKKKGLLNSQKGHAAGEGVAYLKSPMWWTGMIIMILGEICNFVAYAFVEAIIVTPMGALSVVISAILSHFFLREKLSLFGWISSIQCLLGASILALNGPQEQSVSTIEGFKHLFVTPWFLAYGGAVLVSAAVLALWVAPRWGERSMMPYLGVCSLIGGLSVSCTQGLGACIVTTIRGQNQFKNWFIYFLLIFVIMTLLTEIYYLNVALAKFNTAMVTPTYYVTFTFCTLVTSIILYQGLKASASQIITVVLAFAVICTGIIILQMTKVDPRSLANVDERTTLLLEAARQEVDPTLHNQSNSNVSPRPYVLADPTPEQPNAESAQILEDGSTPSDIDSEIDFAEEKRAIVAKTEEPGIDSLRGTFGAIGTIIRARRRATALSAASATRSRFSNASSIHSHDALRNVSTRESNVGRVSFVRALSSRRADTASIAGSVLRLGGAMLSGISADSDVEKGDSKEMAVVSMAEADDAPRAFVRHQESGSSQALPMVDDHPRPARFLSSGEVVSSPLMTPASRRRGSIVRFENAQRAQVAAAHNVLADGMDTAMPHVGDSRDVAMERARTMPVVFTAADRRRAEDLLKSGEGPAA
ncbi:putative magnesium transporter NIPA3 [Grifola frondosa]|uniref:Putative magnesium transporter NIPA3 n=1 Tax=Grifola frondosa TaxID=5627 RepID=A0A1C7LN77_GRIFR|nr:putative magnesium transporter NIPA3 [Grifola frondosa]